MSNGQQAVRLQSLFREVLKINDAMVVHCFIISLFRYKI